MRRSLLAAVTGGTRWTPAQLFKSGDQGFWYDPSDFSTLYQDSAGTTPVTAVEQPVRLMLDKSNPTNLTPSAVNDLTAPTDFSNAAWFKDAVSVTTGALAPDGTLTAWTVTPTPVASDHRVRQNTTYLQGKWYQYSVFAKGNGYNFIRMEGTSGASGNPATFNLLAGTATGPARIEAAANGFWRCTFFFYQSAASASSDFNNQIRISADGTTYAFSGDGTSGVILWSPSLNLRFASGNHALASADLRRPVVSARVNLLLATEDLTASPWTIDPTTTATATTLTYTSASADRRFAANSNAPFAAPSGAEVLVSATFTVSAGSEVIALGTRPGSAVFGWIAYNTATQTSLGSYGVSAPYTSIALDSVTQVSANVWRMVVRITANGTSNIHPMVHFGANGQTASDLRLAGNGSGSLTVSQFDARFANDGVGLPVYQRVTSATDYDTAGFPVYLRFDGTDDCLFTGNIDFSASDKVTVCAGVRKLSDAAFQAVAELSASSSATNGTLALLVANGSAANYVSRSRGTVISDAQSGNVFAAPITNVVTGLGDIANDLSILRANAAQVASNTGDQGTGNYANAPLYIGARGDASLRLSGRIYGLLGVARLLDDATLARLENWVNSRTRAY